jgi:hypothetical protein
VNLPLEKELRYPPFSQSPPLAKREYNHRLHILVESWAGGQGGVNPLPGKGWWHPPLSLRVAHWQNVSTTTPSTYIGRELCGVNLLPGKGRRHPPLSQSLPLAKREYNHRVHILVESWAGGQGGVNPPPGKGRRHPPLSQSRPLTKREYTTTEYIYW